MSDPYNHNACLKSYRALESERDRLKAELENQKKLNQKYFVPELLKERNFWKSKVEELAKAAKPLVKIFKKMQKDHDRKLGKSFEEVCQKGRRIDI